MDNRHNGAVNGIRIGDPHNVFHMGNNGIITDERNVTSKDRLSFKDLKNMELERKEFNKFIEDLKGSNLNAAKRIDFIMNHCAVSQAELRKLNEIASKGDIEEKVSRVVTWIWEEGEIASKDGPAKETSVINGINKAANSFDLCADARQLDKEEIDIDIFFESGPEGENEGEIDTEALDEAVKHFDNLGFVIDKDEIVKKAQYLVDKGKGPIKNQTIDVQYLRCRFRFCHHTSFKFREKCTASSRR